MRTPYFDELCAEIRGIDLGDDEVLRERLFAAIHREPDQVDADAWLLLAVLDARAGDPSAALHALTHAEQAGAAAPSVAFLRAHLLAERGDFRSAAAALQAAGTGEDPIGSADIEHARGALAWQRGDLPAALQHFRTALADDPHDAGRWVQVGRALAEARRWDEADRAFDQAFAIDEDLDEARYERAALWVSAGRIDEGASALRELCLHAPNMRDRARADERWRAVRNRPAVGAVLSQRAALPTWLPMMPRWLPDIVRDPVLADLGIDWLDVAASRAIMARITAVHDDGAPGTMTTPATLSYAREMLQHTVAVAQGPTLLARDRRAASVVWLLDGRRDCLCLALSESYPAFLWIPCGRDAATMRDALAPYYPQPFPERLALPSRARGFIGYRLQIGVPSPYTGELEPANAAELDRHFALSPFVEPGAWGSSRVDDPWPEELPSQPNLQLRMTEREQLVTQQTPGRVWSISRRTRHSRSIFSIELHHRDVFVAEVRYRPSLHSAVIAAINARFGSEYPTDLPIDAAAALLGLRFDASADLEAQLAALDPVSDGEVAAGLLLLVSALRHDDLAVTSLYRRWIEHEDPIVRSTLYNVFVAHNHESLLEEACVTERDAEMLGQIEGVLDEGIAPVLWDPYRDYSTGDDMEVDE
jgi:tetratricopeptide (TPR) repeat protein